MAYSWHLFAYEFALRFAGYFDVNWLTVHGVESIEVMSVSVCFELFTLIDWSIGGNRTGIWLQGGYLG